MKAIKFILAPLLLVSIVTTSLYFGLAKPGTVRALAADVTKQESVRKDAAKSLVDELLKSDNVLLKALLNTDRPKAEAAIARSLGDEQEQRQIGDAVEAIADAMFTGKPQVTIDPQPIYRPIYQGLDAVFPTLKLAETGLKDLDPVVVGADTPLPNLSSVRTVLTFSLVLWLLLIGLSALFIRKTRGLRTVAIQALVVATVSLAVTLTAPLMFSALVSDALQKALVSAVISHLVSAAMWISLVLVIAATAALLLTRERVVTSEGATQSQ